ncbi:MAG: hypothetical protein GY940_12280 [bacterium]|nr:hypothetical protein [bacterium]
METEEQKNTPEDSTGDDDVTGNGGETENTVETFDGDGVPVSIDEDKPKKKKKDKDKKKKEKDQGAGRGIETMFRTSLRNHIALSQIADQKANIMLTVNSIIISMSLSFLFPRFETDPWLVIPTSVLLTVCVSALIFGIISIIPRVSKGVFTKEQIRNKQANLLFFGNFYKMDFEDFEWGMYEMMKDRDFLYGSMIRDFYNLGKVLSVKYKYLTFSYMVFMVGLVISVLVFALVFILK